MSDYPLGWPSVGSNNYTYDSKQAQPKIKLTIEALDAADLMDQLNTIIGTIDPPEPELEQEQDCRGCFLTTENRKATASAYTARAAEAGSLTKGLWDAVALVIKGLDIGFGSRQGFEAIEKVEQQIINLKKDR